MTSAPAAARRSRRLHALLVGAAAASLVAAPLGCAGVERADQTAPEAPSALHEVGDGRYLMGTVLDVTLVGDDPAALRTHLDWVFDTVAQIEDVASRHRATSELARLNQAAGRPPRTGYSPHLRALLASSRVAGERTGGAFDVTVGPLIALWTDAVARGAWPPEAAIDAARARVGYDAIVLGDDGAVGLSRPGCAVDLGGIGKGYALDVVRQGLAARGVERGLLDFGGSSVWALGRAPDGGPWRFELDARDDGGPRRVLALTDLALSVSSSLGDASWIGDRRVGHVVDPRTGLTVDVPRTAVAVGASATEAEVWSTALLVLAPEQGLAAVAAAPGIETWVRLETGQETATPGFGRFVVAAPLPGGAR